ncbi:hypothetical protein GW17_00013590 [Ensete ventricosum]|nr:hypothetical protein GW17_00013590 [Ensete ventricosum]
MFYLRFFVNAFLLFCSLVYINPQLLSPGKPDSDYIKYLRINYFEEKKSVNCYLFRIIFQ